MNQLRSKTQPRSRTWGRLLGSLLLLASITAAHADSAEPLKVEDFGLFDQQGRFHHLYYYENDPETSAIVMFVQGIGCPLVRKRLPELARLQEAYAGRGVRFCMINANPQDTREDIAEEAREYNIRMPILLDETQLVAKALKLDRTAEVLLIEPDRWVVRYRGAISDQLDYETAKPSAAHAYIEDALNALLAGQPIDVPATSSPGCKITYLDRRQRGDISYADTIAPLLARRCVRCHTKDGIGPFAMDSYRYTVAERPPAQTARLIPGQPEP